ncbi:MAG TPA: hypothetical protein GX745_04930 [Clostridiales bacterium]|nr:hypothetical protein [Clostridiales bacterium]
MTQKRIKFFILSALVLVCLFSIGKLSYNNNVYADMGPKPKVVLSFSGLEDRTYYVTLLSKKRSTGPYRAYDENYEEEKYLHIISDLSEEQKEAIGEKFYNYIDDDGFYFLQYIVECKNNQSFEWGYYPPYEFKILIYLPDADEFVSSGQSYTRYAFSSYYDVEVKDDGALVEIAQVTKDYDYTKEILNLLVRIVLTIAIEIGLAFAFRYGTKKHLLVIGATNLITQIGLNVILNITNYARGALAFLAMFFLLELIIFAAEAIVYAITFQKIEKTQDKKPFNYLKPILYALAANALSFGIGFFISTYMLQG